MHEHTMKIASYWSAAFAVISGISLNEIAAIIGIVMAVLTGIANLWLTWRRNAREQRAMDYQFGEREDRRIASEQVKKDRRTIPIMCDNCPTNSCLSCPLDHVDVAN
jgi:hypothetical protein